MAQLAAVLVIMTIKPSHISLYRLGIMRRNSNTVTITVSTFIPYAVTHLMATTSNTVTVYASL